MRSYIDVSHFHAPFTGQVLQGLGAAERQYWEMAWFRAPYHQGYYQDNTLMGLGVSDQATAQSLANAIASNAPPDVARYLQSGAPMGTALRDVATATNQVPRWAYAVAGLGLLYLGYRSYKQNKRSAGG
jgi:hypothetical protein